MAVAALALALAPADASAQSAPVADRGAITEVSAAADGTGGSPAPATDQHFAIHGQFTFVVQHNPGFQSAFAGPNSLHAQGETRETADLTVYAGFRPWPGAEVWANPEIDQGFGLANTLGAAGFPSGEAYKVGRANPYFRLQRLFVRQTIGLGPARSKLEPDLNQLGGTRANDRLVVTAGKIGVGDVFDTSSYAHDPRINFLNWTVIDAGTFDYAADAWGYSYGVAIELYKGPFALRGGVFNLSKVPNSESLETGFRQHQLVAEAEGRFTIHGRAGKLAITGFLSHGNMGRFADAVALAQATGQPADAALVRHFASRAGVSLNFEQALSSSIGVFARAGLADGRYESFEFTDVDRSLSGGAAIAGMPWGRPKDTVGVAIAVNGASRQRQQYLDAGGLGILIGDGRLPHPGGEHIAEIYYDATLRKGIDVTGDLQVIGNPGYNRDRGPVVVLGARLHAQF